MTACHDSDIACVLVTEQEIAALVDDLAGRLSADYAGRNPVLVGALCGSAVFMADLIRRLAFEVTVDFVAVSSYHDGSESSGELLWRKDLSVDITDRPVVLIEDIVDTGLTLAQLRRAMAERGARQVVACALLDKPSRRQVAVEVEYVGKAIPDEFVVGYGLDYNQRFRNLPYVGVLRREVYAPGADD
ncbi:MAG: hypoxanthine phosphoribosyltransferase [Armatimonadetes bacterium]|nr:hypoxanthine phosphoribosyltransferase [Armatimonadota bacterium]